MIILFILFISFVYQNFFPFSFIFCTFSSRLVSRFYQDGYFQKDVELKTVENHYALPYTATVPSFLFFVLSFLPLVLFPELRLLWLQGILLSTVCGYLVLAIKSVC